MDRPELTRQQADEELARLGTERASIASALVELESHPGHELLDGAVLTGETLRRWTSTKALVATIHQQFETYRLALDRAHELRAKRAFGELTTLLHGEAIELTSEAVPLRRRTLTGPSATIERVSLGELVSRMNAAFTQATEVVAAVDEIWLAVVRRLDLAAERLRAAETLASELGLAESEPELGKLRDELTALREQVVSDPLSTPADAGDRLPELVDALLARLSTVGAARDGFAARVAGLRAELSRLEAAEAETATTRDAVLVKIAETALPPLLEHAPGLRAHLDRLDALGTGAQWQRLSAELPALERDVVSALDRVRAERDAIGSLLARRDELRGRLDAYRAKAAGLGHSEDRELARLFDTAHDLLWTAPCDLPAATRALARYQQAVTVKGTQ